MSMVRYGGWKHFLERKRMFGIGGGGGLPSWDEYGSCSDEDDFHSTALVVVAWRGIAFAFWADYYFLIPHDTAMDGRPLK